jgi:hypothetical protein
MDKKISVSDLDDFYVKGEINEKEYLHLAMEDVDILAIATDNSDNLTTVSLMKSGGYYYAEVLYSELNKKDETFLNKEASLEKACNVFMEKIVNLEKKKHHEFEVAWYFQKD